MAIPWWTCRAKVIKFHPAGPPSNPIHQHDVLRRQTLSLSLSFTVPLLRWYANGWPYLGRRTREWSWSNFTRRRPAVKPHPLSYQSQCRHPRRAHISLPHIGTHLLKTSLPTPVPLWTHLCWGWCPTCYDGVIPVTKPINSKLWINLRHLTKRRIDGYLGLPYIATLRLVFRPGDLRQERLLRKAIVGKDTLIIGSVAPLYKETTRELHLQVITSFLLFASRTSL